MVLSLVVPAKAQSPGDLPATLDPAIGRGLNFLAKQQNPDGSFEGGGPKAAMTGLSLMAFLACGHVSGSGKYGTTVHNAVDYLLRVAPEDGYFGRVDGSRMYGHGIITLSLAEAAGVENDVERRKKLRAELAKAVQVILKAQDVAKGEPFSGGWRYEPTSPDSDLSLSGWSALALRASQNTGMAVPKEAVQKAVNFVLRCYHPQANGFGYQPGAGPNMGMTGVGLLNLCLLDAAERPEALAAAKFLVDNPVVDATPFPYYYLYYTTQAAFQMGEPTWPVVWRVTHNRLLPMQMEDGGWPQSPRADEPGRIYATSMAILTLSVPYRLLPIYQR